MSVREFRELGFLQEINRRVLHPCGLALEVWVDEASGEEVLGGIWDYRDDPEGLYYGEGVLSREKMQSVDKLWYSKAEARKENLGYIVQPIPAEEPGDGREKA